jgi:hypothetical protein
MFSAGVKGDRVLVSLGAFFNYYFDSKNLYDVDFRTELVLSLGNM